MAKNFTFRTTKGNVINWTDHAFYPGLVVFEKNGSSWFLVRRKHGEREQRIPLAGVLHRIEDQVTWYGRVFLNPETGRVSRFSSDVLPACRTHRRSGYTGSDVLTAAVIGTAVGVVLGRND